MKRILTNPGAYLVAAGGWALTQQFWPNPDMWFWIGTNLMLAGIFYKEARS
jgi:hypothetical protein